MPENASTILTKLFDAERTARACHRDVVGLPKDQLVSAVRGATQEAQALTDRAEQGLRLSQIAEVLADVEGAEVADLLIDILGSEEPEARGAAGEALQSHAFDRFKEVALGIERALQRLPAGHLALAELPYVIAEVPEPGVIKLLGLFLKHADPEAVAGALEASVESLDESLVPAIRPLVDDKRRVRLDDEDGEGDEVTIGELAREALSMLVPERG